MYKNKGAPKGTRLVTSPTAPPAMATPADPLAVSGTLEPDSTRHSTLHGHDSVMKEKIDAQVESVEGKPDIAAQDDDFPDGGLRAWLVVGGVRCKLYLATPN